MIWPAVKQLAFKALGWLACLYGCVGIVLRLWPRDIWHTTAWVFYGSPWLLVAIAFLAASIQHHPRRYLCLGLAILSLGYWLQTDYRSTEVPVPPQTAANAGKGIRLLFWNMNRPVVQPKPQLLDLIHSEKPDVVALLETEGISPAELAAYQQQLPAWHLLRTPNDMACFSKFPVKLVKFHTLSHKSYATQIEVQPLVGEKWMLWIADIFAWPSKDRFPPINHLADLTRNQPRTIIVGDFNTPLDSQAFDDWRTYLHNGWEQAGIGFSQTWPYGIPLLSLDQLWLSKDWSPADYRKGHRYWKGSDHAWLSCFLTPQ